MLEIRELCLQAGNFQVERINLVAAAGTCHALVGETGSGKTLVLEAVAGLRRAKSGSIRWLGREIGNLPPEARRLAYVPQDLALFPHLTVRQNIEYGLRLKQSDCADRYEELEKLTLALGIRHLLERFPRNLSGGERQRVALARALAPGNTLLLLDEPFSALHEAMRQELWLLLKTLQEKFGITILLVTHDMEEAYFLSDSVSFISCGRIVQSGDKQEVYRYPATVEAAKFFGVQNLYAANVVGQVDDDRVELFCAALGTKLLAQVGSLPRLQDGSAVMVGMRAENIFVNARLGSANSVACRIRSIYSTRTGQVLLVHPMAATGAEVLLKVEIDGAGWGEDGEKKPGDKISVALPQDRLFVF